MIESMRYKLTRDYVTKTRLQKRLIRRMSLVILLVATVVLVACTGVMSWFYHQSDVTQLQSSLKHAEIMLENQHKDMSRAIRDYAVWNDTYHYVGERDTKYEQDNYTSSSLKVMHIDFVALEKLDGQMLFSSQQKQIDDEVIQPLDHSIQVWLAQLPELTKGLQEEEQTSRTYLGWYQNRPLLLSVSGVYDAQQSEAPTAIMVFGRYLDTDFLKVIGQLANASFHFQTEWSLPSDNLFASNLSNAMKVKSWATPNLYLVIDQQFEWRDRVIVIASFCLAICLVLIAGSLSLNRMLQQMIISRVEHFAEIAWQRMLGKTMHWPVKGDDELDLLARSFNGLMDELSAAQKNLQVLSVTDALTTLGNRRSLEQETETLIHQAGPHGECAMLLLDLDGFKLINDSLGHAAGDLLLQEVAQRMRIVMRRQDMLFRMGGDEFAVLMPNTIAEQATKMAERLLAQLIQPVHFGEHQLNISGSIGIAEWREGLSGMDLVRRADLAMYAAKRSGKARICLYEKGMSGEASARMVLEQALRNAIQENEIEPFFQPVIDTDNGQVIALEMLARWWNKDDYVPPAEFIRLAEDLGLIHTLSAQLLVKGLTAFTVFRDNNPSLKLQINISPLQFSDRHLARSILHQLEAFELPTSALVIELTESATLLYPEQVEQTMRKFVEAGVSLHLDDFGTGYSSLARLRDLPFDTVKLDRSFVMMMTSGDTALSKAVFDMATSMHMNLIAEGVETETELAGLKALGYRRMQGFMFAQPMPAQEMQRWLAKQAQEQVV